MDAKAEGHVVTGAFAIDDVGVGIVDHLFIAVARNIPHDDVIAFFDHLTVQLEVPCGCAAHMGQGRLPADGL